MLSLRKSARIKYPDRCRFPDLPEFGIALVKLRRTEFLPVDTELDPLSGHFKIIYLYPKLINHGQEMSPVVTEPDVKLIPHFFPVHIVILKTVIHDDIHKIHPHCKSHFCASFFKQV